ncbi:MAG TPA: hypothetical protein QF529_04215, partial [Candidatus Thalassarchaeaceae archaeon]|nr:hypothetical protein [Candidatus Thalassarchaeaceae archaeon]
RLRKRWQILFLQTIATAALLLLFLRMSEVYGPCDSDFIESGGDWCPSYEHTRGLSWVDQSFDDNLYDDTDGLILPRFLTGIDSQGFSSQVVPLTLCFLFTGLWIFYLTRNEKIKLWTKRSCIGLIAAWSILPFLGAWLSSILEYGFHLPFGQPNPYMNHLDVLFQPLQLGIELFFLGVVFAPILVGLIGIWGLSRRSLTWAVGFFLMVIGLHALLTFEGITDAVSGIGLNPLPAQIGEATLYGGLISPLALQLLEIAILMLLFHESGNAVVGHLEYAMMLPEVSKSDSEYVRQFNSVVNNHVLHTVAIIAAVALTTALALEFDSFMLNIVAILEEGSQWSGQVSESLELQLTYGKVISAGLFLLAVAGMRYVVPWQRVSGLIEAGISNLRKNDSES